MNLSNQAHATGVRLVSTDTAVLAQAAAAGGVTVPATLIFLIAAAWAVKMKGAQTPHLVIGVCLGVVAADQGSVIADVARTIVEFVFKFIPGLDI